MHFMGLLAHTEVYGLLLQPVQVQDDDDDGLNEHVVP